LMTSNILVFFVIRWRMASITAMISASLSDSRILRYTKVSYHIYDSKDHRRLCIIWYYIHTVGSLESLLLNISTVTNFTLASCIAMISSLCRILCNIKKIRLK
jgi:hypothetical protein